MKRTVAVLLVLFLAATIVGCVGDRVPAEVEEFYIQCLEASKSDMSVVANDYCHYEDDISKWQSAQVTDYLTEYSINSWEKLSDELWVVHCSITTESFPETPYYHFVAWIDGRYYVIMNPKHIPDHLKENLDLEKYAPSGEFC